MHSAVLQNKKYIQFAEKNTVEVLTLSQIEKGVEANDRKAARYEVKRPDGTIARYFVQFPGLTLEDLQALNRSKANRYNRSGKIPYTSLVDPFTEKELRSWVGGVSAKTLIEAAALARKELFRQHGLPKLDRKDLDDLAEASRKVRSLLAKKDLGKALKECRVWERKTRKWPKEAGAEVASMREACLEVARSRLEEVRNLAASKPKRAKVLLSNLLPKLRGTALAAEAEELLASLKTSRG